MRSLIIIFSIVFFHQLIIQGTRPLIPLLADSFGSGKVEIGFIAATFAIFPLFFAISAGRWIDKWGIKWPIVIGSFGVVFALILPFLFPTIPMLYISQIFAGFSQIFVNIALQNSIRLNSPKSQRDRYYGWFSFFQSAGQFTGPVLAGVIADTSDILFAFMICAILGIIPVICGVLITRKNLILNSNSSDQKTNDKPGSQESQLSTIQMISLKGMHQAMIASMLVLASREVMMTYFPLYATEAGLSITAVGFILGLQGLAQMVIRLFQGRILLKFSRRYVLFVSLFTAGVAVGSLTFFDNFIALSFIAIVIGLGVGLTQPLAMVAIVNLVPAQFTSRALGVRMAGNRLSQVVSPIIFGGVASAFSVGFIFLIGGGLLMIGSVYVSKSNGDDDT